MRTTVDISDAVLDSARRAAKERGSTLSRLVDDALRRELSSDAEPPAPVGIPVFRGGSGLAPGVDLGSNRSIQELFDDGATLEELR